MRLAFQQSEVRKLKTRYHRFQELFIFGEKIITSHHKLKIMAAESHRRKQEWKRVIAVTTCRQFVRLLVDASLEETRSKITPFIVDIISGKEFYSADSFRRRIISQDEVQKLLSLISLQISTTLSIPPEHCTTAIKESMIDPASFIDGSAGLIQQYKNTIIITKNIAKVTEAVCNKSLEEFTLPWLVKKVSKKLSLGTALLKVTNCHPADQEKRCIADISQCLTGILDSFYQQLQHQCMKNIAKLIYSSHESCKQVPSRPHHLYLVKKTSSS
ncbi:hypothetical protein [Sporomusa sp.]|uniref:hypothetical protein n=1 Tax=Sporomusa sp. TaxID=2078658 RepID=UPI002BE83C27|nr:hypothetical protein [Sporomusa sp.]HWR41908.1 hypothetical protein [Sporomusa sp.]